MSINMHGAVPWNEGELVMHNRMKVPLRENPTSHFLNPDGVSVVSTAPLLAVGALDAQGRPWATVWGGKGGFANVLGKDIIGMTALVNQGSDPVVEALLGRDADSTMIKAEGKGTMIGAVTIDLENRERVKLFGRMIEGTLTATEASECPAVLKGQRGQAKLAVKVEQSFRNCPKYLNKKHIVPAIPEPKLISDSSQLPQKALAFLNRADCVFLCSSNHNIDMDTNYRGGPPGFVRVISNEPSGAVLVYPEYAGSRVYQGLGNMVLNPRAGLVFPDFEMGDALYITARAEILFGDDAAALLPKSNLAVRLTVEGARYVEKSLGFRGIPGEMSPYTPAVRYLCTEMDYPASNLPAGKVVKAKLVKKDILCPSIYRFRFKLSATKIPKYEPGQYAVFSFKDELDMRDKDPLRFLQALEEDPLSFNDDYIRTFTVSSFPGKHLPDDEFEITVRKHARVTSYLFQRDPQTELEVPMLGFGGTFKIDDSDRNVIVPFIAGGIGITPLLGQLPGLDISRLRLFWSMSVEDIGVVEDTFRQFPKLPKFTTLFITHTDQVTDSITQKKLRDIEESGATVNRRRILGEDIKLPTGTFYLCSGKALQTSVKTWLKGKNLVYESFAY